MAETAPILIVNPNIQRFDQQAGVWDENPVRAELARRIVAAVEKEIRRYAAPRIMDYGCGTGLCSIPLAPRVASLLAVDISPGMLVQVRTKADALGLRNIETLQHDLAVLPLENRTFDAIVTAMALHHVKDVAGLLKRFRPLLAPEGILLIADLDQEDGTFHTDATGVEHPGFSRAWMEQALRDAGFGTVGITTVHTIVKPPASEGDPRRYNVFFAAARIQP